MWFENTFFAVVSFIIVFTDCYKQISKIHTAFFWAMIASLFFPPFGVGIYVFYRFRGWL